MATYCFKCPDGHAWTQETNIGTLCAEPDCHMSAIRDWRAEAVGIGSGVRESRNEFTTSGYRDLFLPTADDMRTPEDPSGQKGLREWAETHGPKADNKRPVYPEMERKTFAVS